MSLFANFFTADGFLGTEALFHMDTVMVFIVALPFLVGFSLFSAIRENYDFYISSQKMLFSMTFIGLILFIYGIYLHGVTEAKIENNFFSSAVAFNILVFQIFISAVTIITWFSVIQISLADYKRRVLPGMYSSNHERAVKRVFLLILATVFSSIAVYLILFFRL
jgi:hypothetical protein